MTDVTDRLERLRHQTTRYELVMRHTKTGEKRRVCYTARRNRRGLFDAMRSNGEALVRITGAQEFTFGTGSTATIGDWSVSFSGRTQREAISNGELRWFAAEGT